VPQIPRPLARRDPAPPPAGEDAAGLRVDFRHPSFVTFINDIEKDSEYQSWKANLQQVPLTTVHKQYCTVLSVRSVLPGSEYQRTTGGTCTGPVVGTASY